VRCDPVWGCPVPLGVRRTYEFLEVRTQPCKGVRVEAASGGVCAGVGGEVMFFDGGRGVSEFELVQGGSVDEEEFGETGGSVGEVCGQDGEVT